MKPVLIIIDGPMGSGKTTLAKILQSKIKNCALLSIDVIKHFIYDFHSAEKEKRNFARYEITSLISRAYLKKEISVIIEKSLGDKETIEKLMRNAKPKNVRAYVFKVEAALEDRISRIKKRDKKFIRKNILADHNCFVNNKFANNKIYDSSGEGLNIISNKIVEEINK